MERGRLGGHLVERFKRPLPLEDRGRFKKQNGHELKDSEAKGDRVEEPQHGTENLEDDERRQQLLDVQVYETGGPDSQDVGPKLLESLLDLPRIQDASFRPRATS